MSDMTVDLCWGCHCCNCSSTNDEQISGGWEDMFSATVCQNLHCVQLYQPQCDPSGKRRHTITEYWQFNFTLHYWAAEWLESLRELALFCFSSVMLFIFLSKLIWNTILSTRLWRIYPKIERLCFYLWYMLWMYTSGIDEAERAGSVHLLTQANMLCVDSFWQGKIRGYTF